MNALELINVSKRFGSAQALDNISVTVKKGSLMVLLGPTGAGKTTLQRIVAGLETPDSGEVRINGQDMAGLQPNQRDVSVVFESLALYPNLTAFDNMAHPLKIRGTDPQTIKAEVGKLAEILHVSHILDRKPASFSGGEKQRIAIGRALAKPSAIYLLDEPLSSLDAVLRTQLRSELKRLLSELGHSFVFLTPDYTEALALGDNVNVIMNGSIQQGGSAIDLYSRPKNTEIASFVGNPPINLVPAQVSDKGTTAQKKKTIVQFGGLEFPIPAFDRETPDNSLIVGIRPEDLEVHQKETKGCFLVKLKDQEPLGNRTTLLLEVAKNLTLTASVSADDSYEDILELYLKIDPEKFHFFDDAGLRLEPM